MLSLRYRSLHLALLATNVLVACGDGAPSVSKPSADAAGAAGEAGAQSEGGSTSGEAGATSGEGGRGEQGGEGGSGPPLGCCRAGVACAAGQELCAVECPDDHACAAGQICQQGSEGVFDGCAESCDPARSCGELCCAQGSTCSDGECRLGDLEISAVDIAPDAFKTIEVEEGSCEIQEGCFNGSGPRSVVSLTVTIENVGDAPLHLGAPWESPLFHASPCENAYLLPEFIQAEVLNDDGDVIAEGYLPTSCVIDDLGDYRCTLQGISPGGISEQPTDTCNTLDLTGLAAGTYQLRLTVNPEQRIGETSFDNNSIVVELEKPDCDGQLCGGVCCPSGVACADDVCMLPDLRPNQQSVEETIFITHQEFGKDSCEMTEMCVSGPGRRRLLQFEGRIENWGPGDLDPGPEENNPLYEFSACHGHYHFLDFTDYRLLNEDGSVAAQGHKQSFCLIDMDQVEGATIPSPPHTHPEPGETGCSYLSAGWADIYGVGTPCQWVDITDVPPGDYVLQVAVNPIGKVLETAIDNNIVQVPVQILEDTPCEEFETCGDDIDQDCDNMPDEWDEDCYSGGYETVSGNTSCDNAHEIADSGQFQVNIAGHTSSVAPSCGGTGADAFFSFTLAESEVVFASSEFSDFDTVLALYQTDCSGADVVCADDDCGQAAHFARLLDPGTYVLVVKGHDPEAAGHLRLNFQRTGVQTGTLLDGPGMYAGDTSSSEDNVALACGFGGGDCCAPHDPCNWANDGVCDCDNVFGWDDEDCGGGGAGTGTGGKGFITQGIGGIGAGGGVTAGTGAVVGEGGAGGGFPVPGSGGPEDVYFAPVCADATLLASTCGTADYDSALGIYFGGIGAAASACTLEMMGYNQCNADPNGATTQSNSFEPTVAFVVVDAETEGASGPYQLYVSY